MGYHRLTAHVNAPREDVFDLWVNLDRAPEWIGGLTRVTDVSGPIGQAGSFQGELNTFVRLAEREARGRDATSTSA